MYPLLRDALPRGAPQAHAKSWPDVLPDKCLYQDPHNFHSLPLAASAVASAATQRFWCKNTVVPVPLWLHAADMQITLENAFKYIVILRKMKGCVEFFFFNISRRYKVNVVQPAFSKDLQRDPQSLFKINFPLIGRNDSACCGGQRSRAWPVCLHASWLALICKQRREGSDSIL